MRFLSDQLALRDTRTTPGIVRMLRTTCASWRRSRTFETERQRRGVGLTIDAHVLDVGVRGRDAPGHLGEQADAIERADLDLRLELGLDARASS